MTPLTMKDGQAWVRRLLGLVTIVILGILLTLFALHRIQRHFLIEQTRDRLDALSDDVVREIAGELESRAESARRLAGELTRGDLTEARQIALFRGIVEGDSLVFEAGVAWRPGRSPDNRHLSALHYGLKDGAPRAFRVEEAYDYSGAEWFRDGIESGPIWCLPYFGHATRQWVIGYVVPIRRPGTVDSDPPDGVVRVNIQMSGIRRRLADLPLGSEGYASIIRRSSARVVYHPRDDHVRDRKTFYGMATEIGDSTLVELADRMARGGREMMERPATMTGEVAWNFIRPVPGTDWSIVVLFIRDEMLGSAVEEIRGEIILILMALAAAALLALRLLRVETGAPARLWTVSVFVSILMLIAIGRIWYLSFDPRIHNDLQRGLLYNRNAVRTAVSEHAARSIDRGEPDPIVVPTGIHVRAIRMENVSEILVRGIVWQKIPPAQRDDFTWGVSFPDAIEESINEVYRHEDESGTLTIGWDFLVTLHQRFDFQRFPLDFQNIRIALSRKDFDRHVIFVPDLDAYRSLIPQTLPGLDPSLEMLGWRIERSFFTHRLGKAGTNFGIERFVGGVGYPDLVLNLVSRRHFISPFIANIVPLLLIAGIIFALLMMIHGDKERVLAFDARGGRVTSTAAALFFALLLAHIRLRNDLVGLAETIYIEYFYFSMYAACLAVVTDVLLVTLPSPPRWIGYRDNYIPKLLFWPCLFAAFLSATVYFFY